MTMSEAVITLIGACFLVIAFAALLFLLKLPAQGLRVLTLSRASLKIIGDPTRDDAAKERALQKMTLQLFGTFIALLVLGAATVLVPVALVWLGERAGLVSLDRVLDQALDWRFLIGSTLVMSLAASALVRRRSASASAPTRDYSVVDQTLHELAFATRGLQVALSGVEDRLAGDSIVPSVAPLFIAGLPRAGTTLLLELLEQTGTFASHTYRAMPFVLMPLTWAGYTRRFGKTTAVRQRSHGDGMMVSIESPEALEEMLWMAFWPDSYTRPVIRTWKAVAHPRFEHFFSRHRDKIVHLAGLNSPSQPTRYLSKNNLNIARIDWITAQVPDARVIVPFRDPYQHAGSLLRQHRNFSAIHAEDAFAQTYMAGVGHFDFGANLKPVNFGRWRTENPDLDPDTLSFWLAYWCAAYSYLLERRSDRVALFDFDAMCVDPEPALTALAAFAGLDDARGLVEKGARVGQARAHDFDVSDISPDLVHRADTLFAALKTASLGEAATASRLPDETGSFAPASGESSLR